MSLTRSGTPIARVPASTEPAGPVAAPARRRRVGRERPNWLAGVLSVGWLLLVLVPLYYMVNGSFRTRQDYLTDNPQRRCPDLTKLRALGGSMPPASSCDPRTSKTIRLLLDVR